MKLVAKTCQSCAAPLESGLTCEWCGTVHAPKSRGGGLACPHCGEGLRESAAHCNSCGESVLFACPECRHRNPGGARFCAECRIEFARYREATVRWLTDTIGRDRVEATAKDWLSSGWFSARDLDKRFALMDAVRTWFPVWCFDTRAEGRVTGQQSQTHYRTTTRIELDEDGKPRKVPTSEPYKVWNHVEKSFEKPFRLFDPAARDATLEAAASGVKPELPGAEGEDVPAFVIASDARPDIERGSVYRFMAFRREVLGHLETKLLERVERVEVKLHQPRLHLLRVPVWNCIYRYKRKRRRLQINGATGEVRGESVSVLSQWFG